MRSFSSGKTTYSYSTQKEIGSKKIRSCNPKPALNGLMRGHAFFEYRAKVNEKRLRELGPARGCNRLGSVEIHFYSPEIALDNR
jgi:hypothetical protein